MSENWVAIIAKVKRTFTREDRKYIEFEPGGIHDQHAGVQQKVEEGAPALPSGLDAPLASEPGKQTQRKAKTVVGPK
jgi:hypothetical protein